MVAGGLRGVSGAPPAEPWLPHTASGDYSMVAGGVDNVSCAPLTVITEVVGDSTGALTDPTLRSRRKR